MLARAGVVLAAIFAWALFSAFVLHWLFGDWSVVPASIVSFTIGWHGTSWALRGW